MDTAVGGLLSLVLRNSFCPLQTLFNAQIAANSPDYTPTNCRVFPRDDGKNSGNHALRIYHGAGFVGEAFVVAPQEWLQATSS
jgi:hypothetical protein